MSGFCGFAVREDCFFNEQKTKEELVKITSTMAHRGRDGEGYWIDMNKRIAIGHRRQYLTGTQDAVVQPLVSSSGRYIIAFDGAITNFMELKENLISGGVHFDSDAQVEVLMKLIERDGLTEALKMITGSLGLIVYDRERNVVQFARDRLGMKSVYYGWNEGALVFASELKAIKALPFFNPELDIDSVYQFLKYQYVKSPWSIYKGINKLLPAELLTINLTTKESYSERYYSFEDAIVEAENNPFTGSLEECVDELDRIFTRVIAREVQANVPIGAFLSSGLDSSLMAAVAQKVLGGKLKTYSIGCYSEKLNDAKVAKEYADVLGTDHHEVYVDEKEYAELLPKLISIYDEPFAQPSSVPYYYVSKMASNDVGVCLGGDGGDELFGFIPLVQEVFSYTKGFPYDGRNYDNFADLYDYLQYILFKTTGFRDYMFNHPVPENRHYGQFAPSKIKSDYFKAMCFDLSIFNESETQIKVDRASMANGLQVREPIMDKEIVSFAFRLPDEFRYNKGVYRLAQRKLLARYIPEEMIERKKRPFHIPINRFILSDTCKEVREWAFSESTLKQSGLFNVKGTMEMLNEQLNGYNALPVQSFTNNVLMLQLWLKENGYIN